MRCTARFILSCWILACAMFYAGWTLSATIEYQAHRYLFIHTFGIDPDTQPKRIVFEIVKMHLEFMAVETQYQQSTDTISGGDLAERVLVSKAPQARYASAVFIARRFGFVPAVHYAARTFP